MTFGPSLGADFGMTALATATLALVAGLARGFSGFGAAMVFIPVAGAFLGPVVATPVLLVTDIVMASTLIRSSMGACAWRDIGGIAKGTVIGFPLGMQILTASDPILVRWLTTLLVGLSLVVLGSGWRYKGPQSPLVTTTIGTLSGLMSGLAQVGGPPVVAFWMGSGTSAARVRANLMVYFTLLNVAGLVIFAMKGLITSRVVLLGAASAPGYALGVWAGSKLFPLASPEVFRWIAFALIALATIAGMPLLDPYLRGR